MDNYNLEFLNDKFPYEIIIIRLLHNSSCLQSAYPTDDSGDEWTCEVKTTNIKFTMVEFFFSFSFLNEYNGWVSVIVNYAFCNNFVCILLFIVANFLVLYVNICQDEFRLDQNVWWLLTSSFNKKLETDDGAFYNNRMYILWCVDVKFYYKYLWVSWWIYLFGHNAIKLLNILFFNFFLSIYYNWSYISP